MIKTGLKTFVCSFVLSLFAIFAVNRIIVCAPQKNPSEIKISHKNIALFIKHDIPAVEKSIPVKKIALVKPVSAPPSQEQVLPADILPVAAEESRVETMQVAALPEVKQIPLSIENEKQEKPVEEIPHDNQSPDKKELIIASLEKTALPEYTSNVSASKTEHRQESPTISDEKSRPAEKKEPAADAETSNRANFFAHEGEPENLLIPLEKDRRRPMYANNKITVDGKDVQNQVAMADSGKSLSGILKASEKAPENEDKTENANTPAAWKTMAEKKGEAPLVSERKNKELYSVEPVDFHQTETNAENTPKDELENAEARSISQEQGNDPEAKENLWVAAKGTNFPKNHTVGDQKYFKDAEDNEKISQILNGERKTDKEGEIKVAGEIVKNILIPIPEDILNDKDLTPQLVSDPQSKKLEEELTEREKSEQKNDEPSAKEPEVPFMSEIQGGAPKTAASGTVKKEESGSLLKSLTSIFSGSKGKDSTNLSENLSDSASASTSGNADEIPVGKILPAEIRLSFQPNRAEISGKTLKWVQAFGMKAMNDDYTILEVRIDGTSSFELQQKRLNLVYNILTNLGLDYRKVSTVFTNREPNSFILRTVKTKEDKDKKPFDPASVYYRKW